MSANNIAVVRDYLSKHKSQLAMALPKHLTPDRMMRLALTSIGQNQKLAACDARSLFAAVVVASQLGLEIGVAGQGYLVPYKGKATFVPGWQGLVDLVARAGRATVWTGAVFDGDFFEYALGDSPFVTHRPGCEDDPAKLTHVYAIGRVNGSQWPIIEVWPIKKVMTHRDRHNKVGGDHYSFKYPEMYARKIPLLQIMKYIPKSIEITAAMGLSHAAEEGKSTTLDANFVVIGDDVDPTTGETSPPKNGNLADKLNSKKPDLAATWTPTPEEAAAIKAAEEAEAKGGV